MFLMLGPIGVLSTNHTHPANWIRTWLRTVLKAYGGQGLSDTARNDVASVLMP